MANVISTVASNKCFITVVFLLSMILFNASHMWFVSVQPSSLPKVKSRHCGWTKHTLTRSIYSSKTPPWYSLLAGYNETVLSGRNLYVWPRPQNVNVLRLGNRLFNYAATFGIAWQNQRIPIWPDCHTIPAQYDIAKFFNLRILKDKNNYIIESPVTRTVRLSAKGNAIYDEMFARLPERNVSIESIFASYKYFQHVENELRIDLTFKPHILNKAQQWLDAQTPEKWKGEEFIRVVIHVRRTDYNSAYHKQDGWPMPTSDYFRQSMSFFTYCLERVQFVILSDDPDWCRANIKGTDIVYSSGHSPVVDMAIASLCNHTIITIGTYGWWLAWFANGITITQKNLPRNGSSLSKRLYRADHYKPEWIGL